MKGHIVHDGKQPTRLRAATAATMAILGLSCQAATAEDESKEKVLDTIIVYGVHEDDGYAPLVASVATKAPADLNDTPQSITVITRQQIEDRNFFTVGEALQQVTSVTVMPFDGTNTDYRARGFVLDLAYDGIPAAFSSGIQEFDLSIYERIEVLRGPSGLFRGAGSQTRPRRVRDIQRAVSRHLEQLPCRVRRRRVAGQGGPPALARRGQPPGP